MPGKYGRSLFLLCSFGGILRILPGITNLNDLVPDQVKESSLQELREMASFVYLGLFASTRMAGNKRRQVACKPGSVPACLAAIQAMTIHLGCLLPDTSCDTPG
jgi:hypothetical protein